MNYVVLNGVKSNTIKGLLIQELPPISKPLMRTQIEQIDGRDGDIVTNLGYSSYEKQVKIGLFGAFDIDQVIEYFASSGTVTFSNEPDKYYNYQIIQQIDFERLIRFRQATVTFHVQPFKYSAMADDVTASMDNWKGLPNNVITKNGITITASNGSISFSGKGASGYTEIYLPINAISLDADSYTLQLTANGTGAQACPTRLIGSLPSDADTFGGTYVSLTNNATATQTATLAAAKTFNYLWFYITPNVTLDFTLAVSLLGSDITGMTVINQGNTFSRPTIQVVGSGTIDLLINGNQVLTISLGEQQAITIDSAAMNAYQGDLLMNRAVTGDYDNVVLQSGSNTISWVGEVQSVEVTKISRWI